MFGNVIDQQEFIRLILGIDQQQTITMLQGLIYHTLFLDAFAGKEMQTLSVLNDLILAFGLIGFTLLALQRSLWTVPVIVSWLVLVLLLVLGARGSDVLFTSLERENTSFLQFIESPYANEVVTGMDNAVDSVRAMLGLDPPPPETQTTDAQGNTVTVASPRLGDMLKIMIEQKRTELQNEQVEQVGAFTPMIFTVYIFNRLKYELLKGLAQNMDVDILSRSGLASKLAAGNLYPPTQYLMNNFINTCAEGDIAKAMLGERMLYANPEKVKDFKLISRNGQTLKTALENRQITYGDVYTMMHDYFDDTKVPTAQKMLVGIPQSQATALFAATPALTHSVFVDMGDAERSSQDMLKNYRTVLLGSRLEEGGSEDRKFRNAQEEIKAQKDNILKSGTPSEEEASTPVKMVLAYYKVSAYEQDDDSTGDDSDLGTRQMLTVSNCWELYEAFHTEFKENFGINEVSARVGKQAFNESLTQASINAEGKLIINPTGTREKSSDSVMWALAQQCIKACSSANRCEKEQDTASDPEQFQGTDACANAQKTYQNAKALYMTGALESGLGEIAAADAYFRDPSRQFSSKIRDYSAELGELLGPVALWFFALFGGFAAGAYGAIVPAFMNFSLMLIFAITPFMFMMGVLMPGWAPQIILTPIVVIAYIKLVEVMFVIVGVLFTALRSGLENAGLINSPSFFMVPDTFQAMYDIMVGMAYTSMFALAGFMLVGVRSPEKLIGALSSYGDKSGRIEASEVLKIGAAVKGGYATVKGTYNTARNLGKGAVKNAELIKNGEIPFVGGPSFIEEGKLEARSEISKRVTTRATLQETGEEFLARTQANAVDGADENRVKGQTAMLRKEAGGGAITHEASGDINIKANAANIKSQKADVDAKIANAKAISEWKGAGVYEESARKKDTVKSSSEELADMVTGQKVEMLNALRASLGEEGFSEFMGQRAYNEVFGDLDKTVKDSVKRLGYSNFTKDVSITDKATGQAYEGGGAFDVQTGLFKELVAETDGLKGLSADVASRAASFQVALANSSKFGKKPSDAIPESRITNMTIDGVEKPATVVTLRVSSWPQELRNKYMGTLQELVRKKANTHKFEDNGDVTIITGLNPKGAAKGGRNGGKRK